MSCGYECRCYLLGRQVTVELLLQGGGGGGEGGGGGTDLAMLCVHHANALRLLSCPHSSVPRSPEQELIQEWYKHITL